ncbi:MAG: ABC transporter permease [Azospirillum sp.]|nr:ABC transporter permease [Azospirillum sp.]
MDDAVLMGVSLLGATVRLATPLVLAALGGLYAERAGVADIGLEGKMLAAAFAAAAVAWVTDSPWLGLGAAMAVGVALGLLHAFACVVAHGNQVVSGMAINILAAGLAPTLASAWFHQGGQTPLLPASARFQPLVLPLSETLKDVPILGPFYRDVVGGHNLLVYGAALAIPLTAWILAHSRFGLRLRAVGENPEAVDTAGIAVARLRFCAMTLCGACCGAAGAYLSIAHGGGFIRDMTAGKGFLALAALIFGRWRPWSMLAACLLFAFADALQIRLQGVALPGLGQIPVQFVQMLPYLLTVLLLAGFAGRAVAPRALGRPFVKDR